MMHLMVNRRPVPDKKTVSLKETSNESLVAFALDRQESDMYKPQQTLKHPPPQRSFKSDGAPGPRNEEAVRCRAHFEHGAANSASGDGDGSDWNSSNPKTRGGTRRHRRSASLDAPQLDTIRLGPTLTTSLSFKEPRALSPMPEKLTADDATGKFAYISLDGRLINAELATSVTSIGGNLGDEEACAWEDFAPMQRVLIVAIAAAAKHRSVKEIDRLLKTVENRVLRCNRQHRMHRTVSALASFLNILMSSLHTFLWTLITTLGHITSLCTLLRWAILVGRLKLLPYMMCSQEKELLSLSQELNEISKLHYTNASSHLSRDDHPKSFWGTTSPEVLKHLDDVKVNLNLQEEWSSTKDFAHRGVVESSPDLFNVSTYPVSDDVRAEKEASKWYVNPMVDSNDITTPERCSSMFSACNPAMPGSFEWTVLRSSSFAGRREMVASTLTTPTQTTVSMSSVVDDGAVHKEHKPMRALCAAIVLDLRERILSVLDKEASMVMAALDTSVKNAKIQVASMYVVIASCWNDSLPKALAALSLSPAEFDCYLLNETQGNSPWNDFSKIEENVVAWRQYLEESYGTKAVFGGVEGKSPSKLKLSDEEDVSELVKQLLSKEVEFADLKKGQKALLEAKNQEIGKLKEDLKRRDAELDKLLAAAEAIKATSADRLAMLEELCREKDSAISDLKQDIQSLESKVQKSRVYQSPAMSRPRRYSTPSTPPSSSATPQKQQRFSDKYAPSSDPGSDPTLEHIGRFSNKEAPSNNNKGLHFRNLLHSNNTQLTHVEDLTDDGRSEHGFYDQETSLEYSSPSGSTIGDDCSVHSLVFSETEIESRVGSEYCSSGDDSRWCRSSKYRLSGTHGSSYNNWTLQKHKSVSSDLRRAVTSSASSIRSLTRTQSSSTSYNTSATSGLKTSSATGERNVTKPVHRALSSEMKKVTTKDANSSPGSSPGNSPRTNNLKGSGMSGSGYVNHLRSSSSLDTTFQSSNISATLETSGGSRHNGSSPHSLENSATKRKRWV